MGYIIYWLISENHKNTYVGYSNNIQDRIKQHKHKQVNSTKYFDKFRCFKLENVENIQQAIKREQYWKSSAGRKILKLYYQRIIKNLGPSSSG